MIEYSIFYIILAIINGIVGLIVGAGNLLVPGLLAVGIPAHTVLGTIRLSFLGGSSTSSWRFKIKGYLKFREGVPLIFSSFFASILGTFFILSIAERIATYLLVSIIIISVVLLLFRKKIGVKREKRKHSTVNLLLIGIGSGFVSGAFGIMGGAVSVLPLVFFERYTMKQAIALSSIRGIGSQTAALIVFALNGAILWDVSLMLLIGGVIGSLVGVEIAHKIPEKIIKFAFAFSTILLAIKILFF